MEKHGAILPGVTPPEKADTDQAADTKLAGDAELQAIRALDGDFRKCAADKAKAALK